MHAITLLIVDGSLLAVQPASHHYLDTFALDLPSECCLGGQRPSQSQACVHAVLNSVVHSCLFFRWLQRGGQLNHLVLTREMESICFFLRTTLIHLSGKVPSQIRAAVSPIWSGGRA